MNNFILMDKFIFNFIIVIKSFKFNLLTVYFKEKK